MQKHLMLAITLFTAFAGNVSLQPAVPATPQQVFQQTLDEEGLAYSASAPIMSNAELQAAFMSVLMSIRDNDELMQAFAIAYAPLLSGTKVDSFAVNRSAFARHAKLNQTQRELVKVLNSRIEKSGKSWYQTGTGIAVLAVGSAVVIGAAAGGIWLAHKRSVRNNWLNDDAKRQAVEQLVRNAGPEGADFSSGEFAPLLDKAVGSDKQAQSQLVQAIKGNKKAFGDNPNPLQAQLLKLIADAKARIAAEEAEAAREEDANEDEANGTEDGASVAGGAVGGNSLTGDGADDEGNSQEGDQEGHSDRMSTVGGDTSRDERDGQGAQGGAITNDGDGGAATPPVSPAPSVASGDRKEGADDNTVGGGSEPQAGAGAGAGVAAGGNSSTGDGAERALSGSPAPSVASGGGTYEGNSQKDGQAGDSGRMSTVSGDDDAAPESPHAAAVNTPGVVPADGGNDLGADGDALVAGGQDTDVDGAGGTEGGTATGDEASLRSQPVGDPMSVYNNYERGPADADDDRFSDGSEPQAGAGAGAGVAADGEAFDWKKYAQGFVTSDTVPEGAMPDKWRTSGTMNRDARFYRVACLLRHLKTLQNWKEAEQVDLIAEIQKWRKVETSPMKKAPAGK